MSGYLRIAWHRLWLVLLAGLAGAGLAWVAARPAQRPSPTWSASALLTMDPARPAADVVPFERLAVDPGRLGLAPVPVTAHADPAGGRLIVIVAGQGSPDAAAASARAYAAALVAAGLDGAREERAGQLADLRTREQQVATEALDLNDQLATARAHLSPAARNRGGSVDRGLEAKLAADAAQLTALRSQIDGLLARADDDLAPIRTTGQLLVSPEPVGPDLARLGLGLGVGAAAALLIGLALGALVSRLGGRPTDRALVPARA